jgi:hypothetical protein
MSEASVTVSAETEKTVANVKKYLDMFVLLGNMLKGAIPGDFDDRLVAVAQYADEHPDVMTFVGMVSDLFRSAVKDPNAVKAAIEAMKSVVPGL